jgi:hypothetical protein
MGLMWISLSLNVFERLAVSHFCSVQPSKKLAYAFLILSLLSLMFHVSQPLVLGSCNVSVRTRVPAALCNGLLVQERARMRARVGRGK